MAEVAVSVAECVSFVSCVRWVWNRCAYTGSDDSNTWDLAKVQDFEAVPRMCQLILAVYEHDLSHPQWAPKGGYSINSKNVLQKTGYEQTGGIVPPYIIYLDNQNQDIVVALRGLNLRKETDYVTLWDNKLGKQYFKGGYVHHGLLRSAVWLLDKEKENLCKLASEHPRYMLTFTGHSLGAGVGSLAAILLANYSFLVPNISRRQIRCYGMAPARCMSLNLAVEYADIVHSVILQDDFLPRTTTPLEDVFKSIFCLPCLLCCRCARDTCIPEERLLQDPRRLYAPGRLYHIVDRRMCRCGRYPPIVKSHVPVEGRFEHIVLSCNATSDHSLVWLERQSQKALEIIHHELEAPNAERMTKDQSGESNHLDEHLAALEKVRTLNIPRTSSPSGTFSSRSNPEKDKTAKQSGKQEGTNINGSAEEVISHENLDNENLKLEWQSLVDKMLEK